MNTALTLVLAAALIALFAGSPMWFCGIVVFGLVLWVCCGKLFDFSVDKR